MLWNASAITGYSIEASDGQLGTVSDLLFEDVGWALRWVVVDTGHWLPGRKVLLPLSALGKPNPASRHFPVKLTKQQVKDSPDVDTAQPVSRQIETHVFDYYGQDPYWLGSLTPISNAIATPFAAPLEAPDLPPGDIGSPDAERTTADPHLRSIATVTGHEVHASDGEIGHVKDFLVDDAGWSIRYLVIDTGDLLPGKKVLISPLSVREIDWEDESLHLDVDRQKVKNGPAYDPSISVDGAYDATFLTYYGIKLAAA